MRFISYLIAAAVLLCSVGCGPAFRFRPPEVMPKDTVEVGVGIGAGARMENGLFGGSELSGWVRGGVADRLEFGGRVFTHTFSSVGGAFEFRAQLVRGPFDLTVDGAFVGGVCCGIGDRHRTLAGAMGFDVGLSIGKRFGLGLPAIYVAPHVQLSWTFPIQQSWPKQVFIPVGVDVPIPKTPISLRPELVVAGLFYNDGTPHSWRVGGGFAVAVQGPDVARIAQRKRMEKASAKRRARAQERRALRESRRGFGPTVDGAGPDADVDAEAPPEEPVDGDDAADPGDEAAAAEPESDPAAEADEP